MKEKLTLQDIVDLLAKKSGLSKKEADAFFREFLSVITDNIFNNEPVKIKDFGTFKLTKVSSRDSVNVNTGEKIEIPAHYKLSFIPDKSLKELVNKPFEQFETTLLEDAISFDSIEVSEEPADSPEDEDTSVDEVDVVRQVKEAITKEEPVIQIKRQKEEITSRIESIDSPLQQKEKPVEVVKPIVESSQAATPPSFVYSYNYTSDSEKESEVSSITITVPSEQVVSEPKKVVQAETETKTEEDKTVIVEDEKSVLSDIDDEITLEKILIDGDLELDSEVPLNINKVQEKIDQLRDAIEALEKITWQGETPENSLSTHPSPENADIYNEETKATTEQSQEVIADSSVEEDVKPVSLDVDTSLKEIEDEITAISEDYEDVTDEIARGKRDEDLLQTLVSINKEEDSLDPDSALQTVAVNEVSDDDSDLDFYDYNSQTNSAKKRKRIFLILLLLCIIGFGGYHFTRLFNSKFEYENYKGYTPLTEGDTLPNRKKVQNLIDELKDTANENISDTDKDDIQPAPIVPPSSVAVPAPTVANNEVQQSSPSIDTALSDTLNSATGNYDKIISTNFKIKVLRKAAYLAALPVGVKAATSTPSLPSSITSTSPATTEVATKPVAATTEVVKAGATLRTIAGKYYGHGVFWVYIYEDNKQKIGDFDNLSIGQELIIPSSKKYNINNKDPESHAAARRLEQTILNRR